MIERISDFINLVIQRIDDLLDGNSEGPEPSKSFKPGSPLGGNAEERPLKKDAFRRLDR